MKQLSKFSLFDVMILSDASQILKHHNNTPFVLLWDICYSDIDIYL